MLSFDGRNVGEVQTIDGNKSEIVDIWTKQWKYGQKYGNMSKLVDKIVKRIDVKM